MIYCQLFPVLTRSQGKHTYTNMQEHTLISVGSRWPATTNQGSITAWVSGGLVMVAQ